jgi:uncharacterized repeat protein (TIGR03803 family)
VDRRSALVVAAVVLLLTSAFAPGAWAANTYKVLYKLGGGTRGGVIFDQAGNLYGTTVGGGTAGAGEVFKLSPNGSGRWTETVLYSFKYGGTDGNTPMSGLIFDQAGNLYGTTAGGGANGNYGTVFELTPNGDGTWTETILHSFDVSDGYEPYTGNLIFDQSGNLYGGTNLGGLYGNGVVFQLTPNGDGTWTENVLYSFGAEGSSPIASLIFDQKGNLYGTAFSGGTEGAGAAFQLTPNGGGTWTENVLHWFTGRDECALSAGLIFRLIEDQACVGRASVPAFERVEYRLLPPSTPVWRQLEDCAALTSATETARGPIEVSRLIEAHPKRKRKLD